MNDKYKCKIGKQKLKILHKSHLYINMIKLSAIFNGIQRPLGMGGLIERLIGVSEYLNTKSN